MLGRRASSPNWFDGFEVLSVTPDGRYDQPTASTQQRSKSSSGLTRHIAAEAQTLVHAAADDSTLNMAMRWCGAFCGMLPFRIGRGPHPVEEQRDRLLNYKTGLPFGCVRNQQ